VIGPSSASLFTKPYPAFREIVFEKLSEKPHERPNRLAIKRFIATT
jgi:hypothetical protein